jgi:hypothetical protein
MWDVSGRNTTHTINYSNNKEGGAFSIKKARGVAKSSKRRVLNMAIPYGPGDLY